MKTLTDQDARFMFIILWQTRKIQSFFNLKDKTRLKSNVIYRPEYTRDETHIGETKRNSAVRKAEHESKSRNSKSARHIAKTHNPRIHMEHCVHRVGK